MYKKYLDVRSDIKEAIEADKPSHYCDNWRQD